MTEPTTGTGPSELPEGLSLSTPLGTYGVSVQTVMELVPHVALAEGEVDGDASWDSAGNIRLNAVARWVLMVDATVSGRVVYNVEALTDPQVSRVRSAGFAIVANGAASYVAAAAHGTDAGINAQSYSTVLWERYTVGLTELEGLIDGWLPGGGDIAAGAGLAFYFPPPTFHDAQRW